MSGKTVGDFMPLHPLEFRILITLLRGPAHGYRIVKEIEEKEAGSFNLYPANLYRRLRDLNAKALIATTETPADDTDEDRRRTYFRVTELGRAVVSGEAARMTDLLKDASGLMEPA